VIVNVFGLRVGMQYNDSMKSTCSPYLVSFVHTNVPVKVHFLVLKLIVLLTSKALIEVVARFIFEQ